MKVKALISSDFNFLTNSIVSNIKSRVSSGNPKILFEVVDIPAFQINSNDFIATSFLLISKLPTYSLKKIIIPRSTTVFLLFGIVLFFGLLLIYPFKVIFLSGFIYLVLIPISFLHYRKINKQKSVDQVKNDEDELEDML